MKIFADRFWTSLNFRIYYKSFHFLLVINTDSKYPSKFIIYQNRLDLILCYRKLKMAVSWAAIFNCLSIWTTQVLKTNFVKFSELNQLFSYCHTALFNPGKSPKISNIWWPIAIRRCWRSRLNQHTWGHIDLRPHVGTQTYAKRQQIDYKIVTRVGT